MRSYRDRAWICRTAWGDWFRRIDSFYSSVGGEDGSFNLDCASEYKALYVCLFHYIFYFFYASRMGMTPLWCLPWPWIRAGYNKKGSRKLPSPMSSSSPPSTPSHRTPLTLLSKLKRQLSKSPVTQHQKQPIEHQYLPIPTVSFSESLHSNQALSTYSFSNKSSSSSFLLIDHDDDEQPTSFGVDEYRPFLPLIIQHERLQQQQRLAHPRHAPTSTHRARILPLPHEPPSPTSTASSKSPVTPIFPSSFFIDGDDDDIMTMSNSEVGSISEYSLPRSLSAYMNEARNVRSWRGRKSGYRSSSDSESRHGRSRGLSIMVRFFF